MFSHRGTRWVDIVHLKRKQGKGRRMFKIRRPRDQDRPGAIPLASASARIRPASSHPQAKPPGFTLASARTGSVCLPEERKMAAVMMQSEVKGTVRVGDDR